MGKGGRIACIFLPYLLSIGALVCLILVGLGSTKSTSPLNDIYFIRMDLKDLSLGAVDKDSKLDALDKGLKIAKDAGKLHDFYTVGLWNHCYGQYKNDKYEVQKCTEKKAKYWFDPVEVWDLPDQVEDLFPKSLDKGLTSYRRVAKWLFIAYVIAFVANVVQLLIGITAIFSRWGSFATTIVGGVASLFTILASVTASALYGILTGAIKGGLKDLKITASMGGRMFAITWIAVAFTVAAGIFWIFSVCCCSGRSPYNHKDKRGRGVVAEKTPYTYERVTSPYGNPAPGQNVPMHNMPARQDMAYEPYRHA